MTYQNVRDAIKYVPQFGGDIYYVSKAGSDANDGKSPTTPMLTITAASTAAGAGDAISIMAGTYAEAVTISNNSVELWIEIGVIIAPASGTPLTISGNYCKVLCPGGSLRCNPGANETGVVVSGNWAYLSDIRVAGNSSADIGFDITGDGSVLDNCRSSSTLITAFKVQGDNVKLGDCCTGGNSGDSSIGFWITNSADKTRIKDCGSQGHETAGFQVDTGCTNGVIENCYSGGGDGKWTDADNAFVWSHFEYDRIKYKEITIASGTQAYNLFKVTGAIKVFNIFGHVIDAELTTANTPCKMNLELYSTNAVIDLTDDTAADITLSCIGTVFAREGAAADALIEGEPDNTPALIENASYRDPSVPVICIKDDAADTYIRAYLSADPGASTGKLHFHIEWEPVTDDGFVEPA